MLVCPKCHKPLALVHQDTRAQVRRLSPRLSDQGRHPGDADRRGHDRAVGAAWPPDEHPAGPPAADRRRGVHDARHPGAAPALSRRAAHLSRRSARPLPSSLGNPHLDEVHRHRAHARPAAASATTARSARELRRRRFDLVIDFHGGPRGSWLTWLTRRAAADRLHRFPAAAGCTRDRVERPRELRPRHSVENQWDLLARARHRRRPTRAQDPVEMAETRRRARARGRDACAAAGVAAGRSARS